MTSLSIQQAVNLALELHRTGQLHKAEEIYRQILHADPAHPTVLHYLGLILCQTKRPDEGLPLLEKSVTLSPTVAPFHNNLGEALRKFDRFTDAEQHFRAALAINPQYAEAWNNLGLTLAALDRLPDALAATEHALASRPNFAEAHNNRGNLLRRDGQLLNALAAYRKAIDCGIPGPGVHNNLGAALLALGQIPDALLAFQKALALQPDSLETMLNLAEALERSGQKTEARQLFNRARNAASDPQLLIAQAHERLKRGHSTEAISLFSRAIDMTPNDGDLHAHLGHAWLGQSCLKEARAAFERSLTLLPENPRALAGLAEVASLEQRFSEAETLYQRAIQQRPNAAHLHVGLGFVRLRMGMLNDAVDSFRRAIELDPNHAEAHSCLLAARLYDAADDLPLRFEEHRAWANRHAEPLKPATPPQLRPTRDRIRIGYVSPDFRVHASASFVEPILANHDRTAFEIVCYNDATRPDHVTERFRRHADTWRDIAHLSHAELADQIRRDDLDILIDLTGHYPPHRLKTFAMKPAPIQATYLGYQFTTGMSAIDYRLTDAYLDSPGISDPFYTEKLLRLPHFACYAPPAEAPPVAPSPALANGHITFGSFQRLEKLTPDTLHHWSEILARTPNSRLLQIMKGCNDETLRTHVLHRFHSAGIPADRIELLPHGDLPQYLALHARIDLILDTSPFNGHTTTCHALWMGVPVVTFPGRSYASRMSANVLTYIGHPELIAPDPAAFIELAATLAQNPQQLASLRNNLRHDIERSPLCNAPQFTRELEHAYRQMLPIS